MARQINPRFTIAAVLIAVIFGGGGFAIGAYSGSRNGSLNSVSTLQQQGASSAPDGVTVGGAKLGAQADLMDNAAKADNLRSAVSTIRSADMSGLLKGTSPYTIFAPTDEAFKELPAGALDRLLEPQYKGALSSLMGYHIVPGTHATADLRNMAQRGESFRSIQGEELTPVIENKQIKIKDNKGNFASIETADVIASNGVIHVVSDVLRVD